MTNWRTLWPLICWISLAPVSALGNGVDLSGTVWERAAQQAGVDAVLLYAVALAESAKPVSKAMVSPWPWTLNHAGKPKYYRTREQAAAALREIADPARKTNVDIGYMQVNWRWHGDRVDSPDTLIDPEVNVLMGARILAKALDSAQGDVEMGVGHYHSWEPVRARAYGSKVMMIYRNLLVFR